MPILHFVYNIEALLANFRVEKNSGQVECCEKGPRGKTHILRKIVAQLRVAHWV